MSLCARSLPALATALGVLVIAGMPVVTAEPIKFGTSQSLTGGLAPLGKAMLLTEQMWGEQVNARRGLLGRPIELVFYVVQRSKTMMAMFALAVNDRFDYPRYFQIMPYGPAAKDEISRGFFEAAMTMTQRPKTVALVGADTEFGINALEGARPMPNASVSKLSTINVIRQIPSSSVL